MRKRGPRADIFEGVKAGTTLAKRRAGSAMFIVTWEAPRAAAGGKRSIFATAYPAAIVMYLEKVFGETVR